MAQYPSKRNVWDIWRWSKNFRFSIWFVYQNLYENRISFTHGWLCQYNSDQFDYNMQLYKQLIWYLWYFIWRVSVECRKRVYWGRACNILLIKLECCGKVAYYLLVQTGWLYSNLWAIPSDVQRGKQKLIKYVIWPYDWWRPCKVSI